MRFPRFVPAIVAAMFLPFFVGAPSRAQVSATNPGADSADRSTITIPGPLRSFLRMAGISQQAAPQEVLTLLTFNINAHGYEGWQEKGHPTEFLTLLERYVHQARELSGIIGPDGYIRVSDCHDATPLLKILGYRLRRECGTANASLVTADPERAFLTIDSGFPLSELEATLQGGKPFAYEYRATPVPALFTPHDWLVLVRDRDSGNDLLDALLHNPAISRLYFALSRMDPQTALALRQSPGLDKLLPYGPALAFYGTQLAIRSGHMIVPGGAAAEPAWKDLVGASPTSTSSFVTHLVSKDHGWLIAYFDALSRVNQEQQQHFTEPRRLKRFYDAFRTPNPDADAARPIFRPAPALLLLVTRVQWNADDEPVVPGGYAVWQEILRRKPDGKIIRNLNKHNKSSADAEQLLEAMFALSRSPDDVSPVQVYLALSTLDSRRAPERKLSAQTVRLLADRYAELRDQYRIFLDFPELNDASITDFIKVTDTLDSISDHTLRGNAMGLFEANVSLWQILARQGQIKGTDLNDSWDAILRPFYGASSEAQVFNSGRSALGGLLRSATGKPNYSQDEIIDMLAGPAQTSADGQRMHRELADRMRSTMASQRLVSLDTLMALGIGLDHAGRDPSAPAALIPLAHQLTDFQMPRPIFTGTERAEWASGVYNNRHTDLEMHNDVEKILGSSPSHNQIEDARGQLAPFLRDTLVGLSYAYYEPPGAQVLVHNPLFVRSHDFAAETVSGYNRVWQAPEMFGEGSPAGGGAHLVGSLADLPYVLAEVEQDFITPQNVQALIWRAIVPGLLVSSTLPRWWNVSRDEMHAVSLYQRSGEELITASTSNAELRERVVTILDDRLSPRMISEVSASLQAGKSSDVMGRLSAADDFYLAAEFRHRYPNEADSFGAASQELGSLCRRAPEEVSIERLSKDFGIPHPVLAQSYRPELLNLRPFPPFEGESSRLQAESWEASNLYWARLVDEMGYSPVMLTQLAPQLTQRMVERIFATDLDDWPALVRALHETGQDFQQGKVASLSALAAE